MNRKACSDILLTLLLTGMLMLAFSIQPVRASGTIYIRADGSIDPPTAPIQRDGDFYTFTANILDSIAVQRDNIVIDANGYILQGTGTRNGFNLIWRYNVTIKNAKIKNFHFGIHLEECDNIKIQNNEVDSNFYGVFLESSGDNEISNNRVRFNDPNGIVLWQNSNNNTITANNVSSTGAYGLYLCGESSNNTVIKNRLNSNGIGIHLISSHNNKITGNDASSNWDSGIVLDSSDNNIIMSNNASSNSYDGIALALSENNIVEGNILSMNTLDFWNSHGLTVFADSSNNTIVRNSISSNMYGILLLDCDGNIILENDMLSNSNHAICTERAHSNSIYHNNFVDNVGQVYNWEQESVNIWDDGYLSGGNYWSDQYHGDCADHNSGPNQDIPGSDGIVDTPYVIDANNQDNYPLMEPYSPLPRTIDELKTEIERLGLQGEIDNQGIVTSLLAKLDAAQKLVQSEGPTTAAKNMLKAFINEVQAQSGKHITPEAAEILIESAEHIISNL